MGHAGRQLSRWQRLSITCATVVTLITLSAVACAEGGHKSDGTRAAALKPTPAPTAAGSTSPSPSSGAARAAESSGTGPRLSSPDAPLPGMPPIAAPHNVYADAGANMLTAATRHVPYRIYVPNSGGSTVSVINPHTMSVERQFSAGLNPQHVVPAYDMRTLYATNDQGNSLTPINPRTARRAGPNIPVTDPYNMYFTPDGKHAVVVAEAQQALDFRNPHTFALQHRLSVSCPGVDHMDFSANGGYLIASCEFSGQLVKVNLHTMRVVGYLHLPGSSPQDIKLDPTGRMFYVADRYRGGVWMIRASTFRSMGFIHTGRDAHGLYPSRDARDLYVTNRSSGSVSVLSFATHKVVKVWHLPGGGSPDMGNTSPNGKVLWLAGRYNSTVYAISTTSGRLLAKIPVGVQPHGLCVWPQPGRYSLGHTGVTR